MSIEYFFIFLRNIFYELNKVLSKRSGYLLWLLKHHLIRLVEVKHVRKSCSQRLRTVHVNSYVQIRTRFVFLVSCDYPV